VRLAFAVAAHLEPEILVVDEVLAVGDAEFQKKCLGKMKDVSEREGRTVLFVSHNMAAVQSLCTQAILLEHGGLTLQGHTSNVLDHYISSGSNSNSTYIAEEPQKNDFHVVQVIDAHHAPRQIFNFDEEIKVKFIFNIDSPHRDRIEIGVRVIDVRERVVFTTTCKISKLTSDKNNIFTAICTIPESILVPNTYKLLIALHIPNVEILSYKSDIVSFSIEETGSEFYMYSGNDYGCVFVKCVWE
jgi:lipopolysaccharide transport system ATP-binding protein